MRPNGKRAFYGGVRGSVLLGSAVVGGGWLQRFARGSAAVALRLAGVLGKSSSWSAAAGKLGR